MKKNYLIFILLLFFSCSFKTANLDSLYKRANDKTLPDSVRVKALYRLSFDYLQVNIDSAEKLAQTGAELSFKLNKPNLHANFLLALGGANFYRGNYSKALDYFY